MGIDFLGLQTTISNSFTLTGIGVHSGSEVSVTFLPAEAGTGIVFHRMHDNGYVTELKAVSSQVGNTDLCTMLGFSRETSIATIEHLMAALYAMGVDNVVIQVTGAEIPVMDGSSEAFIEAIEQVGTHTLGVKRRYIRVIKPVRIESGNSWSEFVPYNGTRFEVEIDFATSLIGRQTWKGDLTAKSFKDELSRARTFGFMRDVERLWAAGLALGSSLENSVVISDNDKVVNPEGLRYKVDEFVRHKTLDAVGDLALAGSQFIGCYRSYRGGHRMNALALKALLEDRGAYEVVEAPVTRQRVGARELIAVNAPEFAPWSA
jgi:UDP-3-O-[3-hydroxymyristoyl] N-acetylglucosamine deacetylase